MRSVWKIRLDARLPSPQTVLMPADAAPIHVGRDPEVFDDISVVAVWFEVDTDAAVIEHQFSLIGTGHELPNGQRYIGTAITPPFAWHVLGKE